MTDLPADVESIISTSSSPWGVLALIIFGLLLLLWRYGGRIITLMENASDSLVNTESTVRHVQQSIITNHGSKNLGHAIDRLTEVVWDIQKNQLRQSDQLDLMARDIEVGKLTEAQRVAQVKKMSNDIEALKLMIKEPA